MIARVIRLCRWLLDLPDLIANARAYRIEAANQREANRLLTEQLQRKDALLFEQREEIKFLRQFPKRFPKTSVWGTFRGEA